MVIDNFTLSSIFTAVLSFLVGIFIIWHNSKSRLNQLWFGVSIAAAIWSFSLSRIVSADSEIEAIRWNWALYLGAVFIPIFYYHFVLVLVDKVQKHKTSLKIGYILSFIFLATVPTKLFVKGAPPKAGFDHWLEVGPVYYIYFIVFAILIIWSSILLIKGIYENSDVKKQQIKYIFMAGLVGFSGGVTDFFPQLINFYPVGNYFVIFYIVVVTYVILKHNLMNIKVIATQVFSIFLVVLMGVEIIRSNSSQELLYNIALFLAVLIFAILLIRSVLEEVKRREQLQLLNIQLEEANKHLKELLKMKSEFLAIASHQLRTPLTAIRGLLSMQAEGSFDAYPKDKLKQVHKDMLTSANRLNNIVNDLLDALEVEGGLQLEFKPVSPENMIDEVITTLKPNYDKKGLYLKFDKPASPLPKIDAEERYLSQVFMNLIDNAEKYTRTGGVTVTAQASGNNLMVKVKDTGIGVKPEDQKKLFDKFSRGSEANKINTDGSGLGLFIIKKIVDEHHGKVKIESEGENKGTTFTVYLPIKQSK